jgi:hypothetical protein
MAGNWRGLRTEVDAQQGILTVSSRRLRDIHGTSRLGSTVRVRISQNLYQVGLGHIPENIPDDKDELVRLYVINSSVHKLINYITVPGGDHDRVVRKVLTLVKLT